MSANIQKIYPTTEAHRVKRIACRASYAPEVIHAILDSGYVCHISFIEADLPQIIPMTYWRNGEHVYFIPLHTGGSRMLVDQATLHYQSP